MVSGVIDQIPDVPIADQGAIQAQINQQQANAQNFMGQAQGQQGQSNAALNATTMGIDTAQNAVQNAQNVNQGVGSNVNNAIGLVGQTAAGGGAAQQAANATLQQGTNQALAGQQAIANSGNLSQMVSGQKTALDNAAQIQQQNALNAAQLQAGLATTAQGQYTGAAAQQAGQAAQNAGLQQQQTAAQQSLYSTAQNAANTYASQANTAQGNALTGQTNALGIQQNALGQTGQNKAIAAGGVVNGLSGAAAGLLGSDEDTKTDISFASGPRAGLSLNGTGSDIVDSNDNNNTSSSTNYLGAAAKGFSTGLASSLNQLQNQKVPQWQGIALSSDESNKTDVQPVTRNDRANAVAGSFRDDNDTSSPSDDKDTSDTPQPEAKPREYWGNPGSQAAAESISASFSDKNGKKDINKNDKVSSFLDAIDPVSFKYKQTDGQMGRTPGEHLGVIAQQVEKAPGGKSMVINTPKGKAIDLASAVGTLMAAAAETHDRVKELEAMFQSKRKDKK